MFIYSVLSQYSSIGEYSSGMSGDMDMKEFTSFDVAAVVLECRGLVLNSRVSNVYQLDEKTLVLKLHKPGEPPSQLALEAGKRLHLTQYALEKPQSPPAFCMGLRKYMRNARLTGLEQHEFERVVVLSFETRTGVLKVVLELFGDGNIILVDEGDRILQALLYKRMRDREIVRGEPFKFAPSSSRNPLNIGWEEFASGLKAFADMEVVRALARFLGLGGIYSEEILLRAGLNKAKNCTTLNDSEVKAVFDELRDLLSYLAEGKLEPCIILDRAGNSVDVTPIKLKRYEDEAFKLQFYESFNKALDEFFIRAFAIEKALGGTETKRLRSEGERLKRIIADQTKVVSEAEGKMRKDKRIGDIIYVHLNDLQSLLDRFSAHRQGGKEWKAVASELLAEKRAGLKPSSLFETLDDKELTVYVRVDDLTFGLKVQMTPFENAASYYERSKKEKQRLEGAKRALQDSQIKLGEVDAEVREAEASRLLKPAEAVEELEKRRIRSKEWFEKFRWFTTSDGFLVVAGKDAVSNEVLIKRHTEESDIVFHAEIVGAPFVVVKAGSKKPSEQCLKEAGEFAAALSRGWREGFGSVDVYWVRPEQLSKAGPSGEYVGHGSFVVRGERHWMRGVPLKLAVGIVTEEGNIARFAGGPVDAVKAKTDFFVLIAPGDLSGKEFLKQILSVLARKPPKELREKVLKSSIEEIRDFVPFNKGRILEK